MVLVVGALGAALGGQPLQMILLAQGANALALPWFAFLLLRLATLRSESSCCASPRIVLAGALGLAAPGFSRCSGEPPRLLALTPSDRAPAPGGARPHRP